METLFAPSQLADDRGGLRLAAKTSSMARNCSAVPSIVQPAPWCGPESKSALFLHDDPAPITVWKPWRQTAHCVIRCQIQMPLLDGGSIRLGRRCLTAPVTAPPKGIGGPSLIQQLRSFGSDPRAAAAFLPSPRRLRHPGMPQVEMRMACLQKIGVAIGGQTAQAVDGFGGQAIFGKIRPLLLWICSSLESVPAGLFFNQILGRGHSGAAAAFAERCQVIGSGFESGSKRPLIVSSSNPIQNTVLPSAGFFAGAGR